MDWIRVTSNIGKPLDVGVELESIGTIESVTLTYYLNRFLSSVSIIQHLSVDFFLIMKSNTGFALLMMAGAASMTSICFVFKTGVKLEAVYDNQCNLDHLKRSIVSKKFKRVRRSASLKETVALAKAELLLQNPFLESFPTELTDCESKLAKESSSTIGLFHDVVIKQVYLDGLLELLPPEAITNDLLKSANGTLIPTSIVDIGANVGQTVIPLAKDGHKIYSFEPVDSTCQTLKGNIEKSKVGKNVEVFCVGIDDKEETKTFGYTGKKDPGSQSYSIIDPSRDDAHVMSTVKTAPVQKFLGDDMLNRIQLFKTDTQGNEESVLRGSYDLFISNNRPRFVLIEFSYALLGIAKTDPRKILEMMTDTGYVCTHLAFHHLLDLAPTYGLVDTPKFLQTGSVTATFDEFVSAVGPNHKTWKRQRKSLKKEVQGKPGWTDLLCFS